MEEGSNRTESYSGREQRQAAHPRCHLRMEATVCPWHHVTEPSGSIRVYTRGAAFLDDEYREDGSFARLIAQTVAKAPVAEGLDAVKELVARLNGAWALAVQTPDGETLAAVDRLRSIPLFYARDPAGDLVVAPSVDNLADCVDAESIEPEAELEFLLSGYVMDGRTLLAGVRQIQPGEILHWTNGSLSRTRYYRFLPESWSDASEEELARRLEQVLHGVFSRLAKVLSARQVIVPLSGGVDSRLVAAMLKIHGHPHVLALSYGQPGSRESEISRQVTEALAIDWKLQPYEEGEWYALMASDPTRELLRYAGQACSLPHLQDYLAFHQLLKSHRETDAVVVTGIEAMITGEAGPCTSKPVEKLFDSRKAVSDVFTRRFTFWPVPGSQTKQIRSRIEAFFAAAPFRGIHDAASAFYLWEFENRQALYQINSVRAYEFHGLGWWKPLCDNHLMDFFLKVHTPLRFDRRLYIRCVRDRLFSGQLSALARIPVAGAGEYVWNGQRRPARHGLRRRLATTVKLLLPRSIEAKRMQRVSKRCPDLPLRFDEWFARSQAESRNRKLGDVLNDPRGPFAGLRGVVAEIVSSYRDYPLRALSPLGLLAAAYLADLRQRPFVA